MKTTRLFSLLGTALVGFGVPAWAGPHGGGFAGGGNFGGFAGAGHFGGSGGIRAAPTFSGGGVRFSGNRSIGGLSGVPQHFSYYSGARTFAAPSHAFVRQLPARSISPNTGRAAAAANRQSNRVDSTVGQKRVSDSRLSTAANRQSFMKDHAFARHDANWRRDWDKRRTHFDHGRVFIFIDGFWWGLYPWDYYSYYADGYPYDYNNAYPSDYYNGYPYDYYNGYYPNDYYQDGDHINSTNVASDQYASNPTVSAVQSKLAKLGYYRGSIDGVFGDKTEAAIARYQEDHDLSVTGTVTEATLQSLGLPRTAS